MDASVKLSTDSLQCFIKKLKKCTLLLPLALSLAQLRPQLVQADTLYKCSGIWQTAPCKGSAQNTIIHHPPLRQAKKKIKFKRKLHPLPRNTAIRPEIKKTRLRITKEPEGEFRNFPNQLQLLSTWLRIKNTGRAIARDIEVTVVLPSGQETRLDGPKSLQANEEARYENSNVRLDVKRQGKLKARVTCSNYRK